MSAVVRWVLREQQRGLAGWVLGMAVVCVVYGGFYPLMGSTGELQALIDTLPPDLMAALGYDDIATATGYLESTVFGLLGPILLLVAGTSWGARLLAGDEEAGALELETAAPVSRRAVVLGRWTALALGVVALGVVAGAVTLLVVTGLDLDVRPSGVVAVTVGLVLLGLASASVTFAVGAATGRRGLATAVGAVFGGVSFVGDAVLPLLEGAPAWTERSTPFGWYLGRHPLETGFDVPGSLALLAVVVVATVLGVVAHDRRDLGV